MKESISQDAGDYLCRLNAEPGPPACNDVGQSIGFPSRLGWRKLAACDVIRDDRGRAVCFMKPVIWQCDTPLP